MNRRNFILAAASGLFLPEPEPVRAYSFVGGWNRDDLFDEVMRRVERQITAACRLPFRYSLDGGDTYEGQPAQIGPDSFVLPGHITITFRIPADEAAR